MPRIIKNLERLTLFTRRTGKIPSSILLSEHFIGERDNILAW
jgi:hypothetical protein